ncbi:hypothetical protein UF75_0390 [Desulfosporosinus sp. I2]|nr:hypothetical protein UF75_0390 [Desulfosporosinus sp. I2]
MELIGALDSLLAPQPLTTNKHNNIMQKSLIDVDFIEIILFSILKCK